MAAFIKAALQIVNFSAKSELSQATIGIPEAAVK